MRSLSSMAAMGCLGAATFACLVTACATTRTLAPVPSLPRSDAPERVREVSYAENKLTQVVRLGEDHWQRSDGRFEFAQLGLLAARYPETQRINQRAGLRVAGLVLLGSTGVALAMAPATNVLFAPEDERLSRQANLGWLLSGALVGGATLLLGLLLPNPKDGFARTYNGALRRELALPAHP